MDDTPRNYVNLGDDEVLWRRVPDWQVVPDGNGAWRPSSGAFLPHRDDGFLSVYLASETRDPQTLLIGQTGVFFVVGFAARSLRELGLRVFADPQPEPPVGHYQVEGSKKKTRQLKDHCHWVIPPPPDFVLP